MTNPRDDRPAFVPDGIKYEHHELGHVFKNKYAPSEYARGTLQRLHIVECPVCKATQPDVGSLTIYDCRCGMRMRYHNGEVVIWREKTP